MILIKTFQDLQAVGQDEASRIQFIYDAIQDHKQSEAYRIAVDAELYARGKNATISKYQKLLYTLEGRAVPDNYTANHKCKSGFFKRFVTQQTAYKVGNGVTFENDSTKEKLGGDAFDTVLYKGVKSALIQGCVFAFFNLDHVEMYKLTEFVPLFDEENGALKAGIRFWQIDETRPLRATLFELDGYTDYIQKKGETQAEILHAKRTYIQTRVYSQADGEQIFDGENYPSFPVVPLYGNMERQSELVGIREQIDCYDLIKSGFANDLDDASMIYWTINGADGMEDIDLVKFVNRMKTVRAAVVGKDSDGQARAESHTMEVPYQSREAYLNMLKKDLYSDAMGLDVEQISAGGAVTATQIDAAYEPLNEKTDELEMCLFSFFKALLSIAGIEDTPSFTPSKINNQLEQTQMILSAANYLDDETILKKLPFITADEVENILRNKDSEDMARFPVVREEQTEPIKEGEVNENNAD